MAQPSFSSRVADRVVGRMEDQAGAIVNANPTPPGFDQINSFDDFMVQWRNMPAQRRQEMWSQLDPAMRQRMIDEFGIEQILADLGADQGMEGGPPQGPMQRPMPNGMPPGMPMPGAAPGAGPMPRSMPRQMAGPPQGNMPMPGPIPGGMR